MSISADSLAQLASNLDAEAAQVMRDAKGAADEKKRLLLPRASACYGAAFLLREIVRYR